LHWTLLTLCTRLFIWTLLTLFQVLADCLHWTLLTLCTLQGLADCHCISGIVNKWFVCKCSMGIGSCMIDWLCLQFLMDTRLFIWVRYRIMYD
ncbi:hypothetical protein L9F63_024200, partial [Diploptera punctata]